MNLQKLLTLFPLAILFVVLLGTAASFAVTPDDFSLPPSNYEPMNIYIKDYSYMGYSPVVGDTIAVFNEKAGGDTLCVGLTPFQKDYSEYGPEEYVRIIAYKEYKENGVVLDEGFTEGDTLKFYLLVAETRQVIQIPHKNVTYLNTSTGEPLANPVLFYGRGTALVEIKSTQTKLTINVQPEGVGETIPKADEYMVTNPDSVITIEIDPAQTDEHHEFVNWTVDGATVDAASVQVQMNENHDVTANFAKKQYTLTSSSQPVGGEISLNPAGPTYDALTTVDIFAKWVGDPGYKFSHWEATPGTANIADPNAASTTIEMTSDISVVAVFTLEQDSLFVNIDPANAGTTTPAAGQWHVYDYGTQVTLNATPATGYVFKHWAEHKTSPKDTTIILSTANPYNIQMEAKRDIYAVFTKKSFTLSLSSNDTKRGDIYIKMPGDTDSSKAAAQYTLEHGSTVTLYAVTTDEIKYPFANWSGDIDTEENPVIVTVESNMSVNANFDDTTPVELASFTAQKAPNSVSGALLLKWQTASETNNLGFDVERSIGTETNWQKIGFLEGHGTTSETRLYEFVDEDATTEGAYYYRLKQNDTNGAFEYSSTIKVEVTAPSEFSLLQNYPNPFNPSTQIVFRLKEDVQVNLTVFDLLGREVATVVNETMKAGSHKVSFDASDLGAGIYFYSLQAGSFHEMKKMTLIK